MVVLGEFHCLSHGLVEAGLVPAFKKPASVVAKGVRCDEKWAVAAFFQRLSEPIELLVANPPLSPGHFFRTAHFQSLSMFEGTDVTGRIIERVACSCVEPGHASSHQFNPKLSFFQVHRIEIGDL